MGGGQMEMGTPEAAKKRILPTWMTKRALEPEQPLSEVKPRRRKKAALMRTETIYCMNEAELVDMALCILAEECMDKEVVIASSEDEAQGPQLVLKDPQQHPMSDDIDSKAKIANTASKPLNNLGTLVCSEKIKLDDDDDDVLKYVREIFFS